MDQIIGEGYPETRNKSLSYEYRELSGIFGNGNITISSSSPIRQGIRSHHLILQIPMLSIRSTGGLGILWTEIWSW